MAPAYKVSFVPLLVFVFLIINIHPSKAQNTQQLIEKICRSMEVYGFCKQTFDENLKSPNADIVAITQITVERATDNATKTHDFIRQTLESTTDPAVKSALTVCENVYALLMQSFDSAAVSFFQKDYTSVEKNERGTAKAEASCERILHTPPNDLTLLDDRNRQMRILIAMAVTSVTELLGTKA
ncbi:uncharacterized protein LOC126800983 [Argentina anserina]|uniref:uncharacterized protein LOC126800983 n=1 Tax=Argentina anserina TaxID=57926 RepID=UPI0021767C40|nr:uncharacterized protein LOC126800983 [Potentilla anserina]